MTVKEFLVLNNNGGRNLRVEINVKREDGKYITKMECEIKYSDSISQKLKDAIVKEYEINCNCLILYCKYPINIHKEIT